MCGASRGPGWRRLAAVQLKYLPSHLRRDWNTTAAVDGVPVQQLRSLTWVVESATEVPDI